MGKKKGNIYLLIGVDLILILSSLVNVQDRKNLSWDSKLNSYDII